MPVPFFAFISLLIGNHKHLPALSVRSMQEALTANLECHSEWFISGAWKDCPGKMANLGCQGFRVHALTSSTLDHSATASPTLTPTPTPLITGCSDNELSEHTNCCTALGSCKASRAWQNANLIAYIYINIQRTSSVAFSLIRRVNKWTNDPEDGKARHGFAEFSIG